MSSFQLQRDGSFDTYQVRMAAAVCTFLMECLVVSWELLIFGAQKCLTLLRPEYVSHTDGFCATSAVLSRIPRGELAELVCSPVEEYGILDIDADTDKHVSDSEIRAFLLEKQGIANPLMVQSLEKGRRNEVLRSAKLFGAGIRQLSRLTGVSFGVIQKI